MIVIISNLNVFTNFILSTSLVGEVRNVGLNLTPVVNIAYISKVL